MHYDPFNFVQDHGEFCRTMTFDKHLVSLPWKDYGLLDSGENMKLERFGEVILARPETQALWAKRRPELWREAHAEFSFSDGKGTWHHTNPVGVVPWELSWRNARFIVKLTNFKHVGIFPEQASNWEWIGAQTAKLERPKVLNLFGYTGIASIVAAQGGAFVTHVDASKQSLDWAHENARLSGIPENVIRWVLDDAFAFAKREVRRGAEYDGIILDPPAFGRGAKGEVWHIEEDFPTLLLALKEIFPGASGSFFLASGYTAGYASRSFAQAVEDIFPNSNGESGELHIQESSGRVVPAGIYVRFTR